MSKKFKSQASSSRAAGGGFGGFGGFSSLGTSQGRELSSLTYVAEPPDLSRIAEPQLAIAFKNFSKKDEVTRTKALDDIRSYVSDVEKNGGTLDDGFLEAWVRIYPRASIDVYRRVRQTAHSVQGSVASLVGKRIARFLPKVIGAWLAGVYDNDKPVHQSALESFTRVFSTDEKRAGVWKIYQSHILDFVDDVILQQTPHTLSDERTVKPDDAEAKYARVVGTAILLLNRVLGNTTKEDRQSDLHTLGNLLSSKSLWAFCYHDDPFVRRSLYILLRTAVSGEPEELDWKLLSAALIGKSLSAPQLGSASELSETLLLVTSIRPQIWTTDYSGKSSASKRLLQYIRKGSQSGPEVFWSNLYQLLQLVPIQTLASLDSNSAGDNIGLASATALMDALHEGLSSRDEPQQNKTLGWKIYVEVAMWLAQGLNDNDTVKLLQDKLCPLVVQHVKPEQEGSRWSLPAQSSEAICSEYLTALIAFGYEISLNELWTKLANDLLVAVRLSSPEQSKDFRTSQDAVCAQARRLFSMENSLLSHLADREYEISTLRTLESLTLGLLNDCLQVLQTRKGKPYGAAAVVEEMVRKVPQIAHTSRELQEFVQNDASELLFSPSGDQIITIALLCRSWPGFGSSFEMVVKQVAQLENVMTNAAAVQKLLLSIDFNEVDKEILGPVIMRALELASRGSQLHWSVVIAALQNPTSQGEMEDSIFLSLVDILSSEEEEVPNALRGLTQIASSVPSAVARFHSGSQASKLAGKLLFLTESPSEEVATLAESLLVQLKKSAVGETSTKASLEILQQNLAIVSDESLSIESLLSIAEELLRSSKPEDVAQVSRDILPSQSMWEEALGPFLELPPRLSTAITSPLSGIVHLIGRGLSETFSQRYENIARDSSQCSAAFRLAHYTVRALSLDITEHIGLEEFEVLFYNLPLVVQLIEDDLVIEGYNYIAGSLTQEQREEYGNIVNDARKIIQGWSSSTQQIASTGGAVSATIASVWETRLENLEGISPVDYRVGQAFTKVMEGVDPSSIALSSEAIGQLCRGMRSDNAIRSAARVVLLRRSILQNPAGVRVCNEFIADSTGLKVEEETGNGLRKLSLLNLLLSEEEELNPMTSMPTQRLIFFVKHLIQCLQSEQISLNLTTEAFKALTFALPNVKEMYGPHWEDCLEILNSTWQNISGADGTLPVLYASYRLYSCLESIVKDEDSNDDVKDAWADRKKALLNNLTSTLWRFDSSTTFYLPRDLTVDRLCDLIKTLPVENLEKVTKVFPLLTAHSLPLQHTAYTLLHRYIPSVQEQVSFDVALTKSEVKLPYELISLLLGAPTMESISATYGDDKTWADIRSYLLSWKLIFDHFANASLALQEQYASDIKEHDVLTPLLEFTFDFLQKGHGKLVDASRLDIRSFEPCRSESYEKETQWLLVHLYLLSLKHLANLTKAWWIDSKKRTKGPVEAWTEKFISPLVAEDSLERVTQWMSTQDPNEERALNVKVASKTAEIIASIPIDEDSPPVSLSISLPPAYPLHPALVVGRSRVLVDERKWKSWLLTIQGVIMFSNGALEDGLLAFRKNVQGALKGQSECAICYSVISTDMQTPNKRCVTCKNAFHSVCLFRWFKSSNQSTCPLCRNHFSFA